MISYIDREYTDSLIVRDMYASEQWDSLTDSQKEKYLNQSALLLDQSFIYAGKKYTHNQILEFPRFFCKDYTLNGEIPLEVKQAQIFILSYLLKTMDYEELRKAGQVGINRATDEINIEAQFGFFQIPVEAANLLFPFTRTGWIFQPIETFRGQYGIEEDIL